MDLESGINRHCWSAEGIWGDASCPELAERVHCYNCPVYSEAGKKLFDRRIPVEYIDEWSDEISASANDVPKNGIAFFLFKCAGENLALPMSAVSEGGHDRFIHRIPHKAEGVISGLVNINGELVIAVDIAGLLNIPRENVGDGESVKMIVCSSGDDRFVFRVEKIAGMALVEPDALTNVPITLEKSLGGFVEKMFDYNSQRYGVIDFELLVHAITANHL